MNWVGITLVTLGIVAGAALFVLMLSQRPVQREITIHFDNPITVKIEK